MFACGGEAVDTADSGGWGVEDSSEDTRQDPQIGPLLANSHTYCRIAKAQWVVKSSMTWNLLAETKKGRGSRQQQLSGRC